MPTRQALLKRSATGFMRGLPVFEWKITEIGCGESEHGVSAAPWGDPRRAPGLGPDQKQKSPRSLDLGLFHSYLVPRRAYNQ